MALANMTRPLPAPKHVTISSWGEGPAKCFEALMRPQPTVVVPELFRETTHLSISEPGVTWARPRDVLAAVGPLPQVTHLHLPRRTHANSENDAEFLVDLEYILDERPSTKLSVSVLPGMFTQATKEESGIKAQLIEAYKGNEQLMIREDVDGTWRRVWEGLQRGVNGVGMEERFWQTL
ncbi:hypothetical protein OF83DRAFT_1172205 [Amylostereum chailletii]|nr:hypothetical protein OF83DRAFT_1172205 [Amylostereum chailletii]